MTPQKKHQRHQKTLNTNVKPYQTQCSVGLDCFPSREWIAGTWNLQIVFKWKNINSSSKPIFGVPAYATWHVYVTLFAIIHRTCFENHVLDAAHIWMPVVCASQVTLGSSQAHFGDGVSVHLQPCAGAMFCCCESTPEVTVEVHSSPVLDEVGLPTRGRHEATNVPDVDPFLSDVQKWKKQKDMDIVYVWYILFRFI